MKRSEINALIVKAKEFYASHRFNLPKWAFWGPEDWKGKGESEVVHNMLGWDLTDYGKGDFDKLGLILFTIRNGNLQTADPKPYAEKIMILREGQLCPMHFHWSKREDIINRAGGNLAIKLYGSNKDESMSDKPLKVSVDGFVRTVEPGGVIVLEPGESICLEPGMYHCFYCEEGTGDVMVGEVSAVNDDNIDNRFHEPLPRFPEVDEDEEPIHLLVTDYARYV
ncbi:D-lyxose/D-mannose family sugar isomerase [Desulfovibrio sp. JC022]|uniref:D-lyxose/D-mannose family sugar isomerase n=1 Tax=Desulfovibrio sp. JC022 TaxID=2593642 RepID=UPI0013CFBBEF|nr:D-lyxose/D-mannose family sugar isomerase [Desulfovibrio sp. JC022]NDV23280.1 D-lyxose/D-mannose family sugar isomerase [Desulfovibrio sp. JC022]